MDLPIKNNGSELSESIQGAGPQAHGQTEHKVDRHFHSRAVHKALGIPSGQDG
jgi:hypothetical protein